MFSFCTGNELGQFLALSTSQDVQYSIRSYAKICWLGFLTFWEEPGPHSPGHKWLCGFASPQNRRHHLHEYGPQMCWLMEWKSPRCIVPMDQFASGRPYRDGHCTFSPPAEHWCLDTGLHLRSENCSTVVSGVVLVLTNDQDTGVRVMKLKTKWNCNKKAKMLLLLSTFKFNIWGGNAKDSGPIVRDDL